MDSDHDAHRTEEDEHLPPWAGIVRMIAKRALKKQSADDTVRESAGPPGVGGKEDDHGG